MMNHTFVKNDIVTYIGNNISYYKKTFRIIAVSETSLYMNYYNKYDLAINGNIELIVDYRNVEFIKHAQDYESFYNAEVKDWYGSNN